MQIISSDRAQLGKVIKNLSLKDSLTESFSEFQKSYEEDPEQLFRYISAKNELQTTVVQILDYKIRVLACGGDSRYLPEDKDTEENASPDEVQRRLQDMQGVLLETHEENRRLRSDIQQLQARIPQLEVAIQEQAVVLRERFRLGGTMSDVKPMESKAETEKTLIQLKNSVVSLIFRTDCLENRLRDHIREDKSEKLLELLTPQMEEQMTKVESMLRGELHDYYADLCQRFPRVKSAMEADLQDFVCKLVSEKVEEKLKDAPSTQKSGGLKRDSSHDRLIKPRSELADAVSQQANYKWEIEDFSQFPLLSGKEKTQSKFNNSNTCPISSNVAEAGAMSLADLEQNVEAAKPNSEPADKIPEQQTHDTSDARRLKVFQMIQEALEREETSRTQCQGKWKGIYPPLRRMWKHEEFEAYLRLFFLAALNNRLPQERWAFFLRRRLTVQLRNLVGDPWSEEGFYSFAMRCFELADKRARKVEESASGGCSMFSASRAPPLDP